ncbi:hypothetical protein GCM10027262_18400 [Nocardia tengchongensis]
MTPAYAFSLDRACVARRIPKIGRVDAILTTIGVVAVVGLSGAAYAAFLLLRGRK